VSWADQRFVVDAFSTDKTVVIAQSLGAEVFMHEWTGYSDQKNWALENLPIQNDWVLFLDADERVSPELAVEIQQVVLQDGSEYVGYYMARRMIFLGRWLKHTWWYPDYNLRLFKRRLGRFENRLVHETVVLNGPVGHLHHDLIHDDQRDIATYVGRLNRYSSLEAQEMYRVLVERCPGDFKPSWRGNRVERRRAFKECLWYRLPFRPFIRFIWTIVFRLGFLDGREGLIFTGLAMITDWLAGAKFYELMLARQGKRQSAEAMPSLPCFVSKDAVR
jgi:glycosyltransferase involved in cell wall biosynthesis